MYVAANFQSSHGLPCSDRKANVELVVLQILRFLRKSDCSTAREDHVLDAGQMLLGAAVVILFPKEVS